MAEPKLHDMKRTKAEKKERDKEMSPRSSMDGDYHYGLRVHMGAEELDKLGIKDNPQPGEVYHIRGHAKVVRAEHSKEDGQPDRRHVEFHFHKMAAEPLEGEGGKKSDPSLRQEIEKNAGAGESKTAAKSKAAKTGGDAKDEKGEAY